MTPTMQKAIDKNDIRKSLIVEGKFKETEKGYSVNLEFCGFKSSLVFADILMCHLLKKYGFIHDFVMDRGELEVIEELDADGKTIYEKSPLDDYMRQFSQKETIMFLEEYHFRKEMQKEIKEAVKLSCDAKQATKLIN